MTILRERQCLGHRAPRSLVGICNRGPFGATLEIRFAIWVAQIICCGLTYGPPRPCQMNQRKTTHFGGSHFETNEFGAPRVSKRCSFADSIGRIAGPRSILCLMSEEKAVVRFFFLAFVFGVGGRGGGFLGGVSGRVNPFLGWSKRDQKDTNLA